MKPNSQPAALRCPAPRDAWLAARLLAAALAVVALPDPATASTAALCDRAAARAAAETGVPLAVLRAIARTETGRTRDGRLKPWPWTVNMEGKGRWFETRDGAHRYTARHAAEGARSFDVGCFQINHRWHGDAFDSLAEMFDPLANARYAADFLSRLHAETGDWTRAVGTYHSRSPALARRYTARFGKIYRTVSDAPLSDPAHDGPEQMKTDIVTHEDGPGPTSKPAVPRTAALGSLVPLEPAAGPAFIAIGQDNRRP